LCVSVETSFGLAGVLVPAGAYCLKTAWQRDRSALPLAAVPLFFGIQQCSEGLVWIAIGRENSEWTKPAALVYLFLALTFWLFWIPFSAAFLESKRKIKLLLGLGAVLGLTGGLAFYLPILLHPEVLVVSVEHHSIRYDFTRSAALKVISELEWHVAYLVVVSLPLLLVARQRRGLIVLGTVLVASAAISHFYFWYAYTSVWCFFSAVLSLVFAYVFHKFPLATSGNFDVPSVEPVSKLPAHG
jgi:hypothetical protein